MAPRERSGGFLKAPAFGLPVWINHLRSDVSELAKRVAQLADVIAVVRPRTVELSPPPYNGRPTQLRNLEVVSVIRNPEYSQDLASLNVDVNRPEMMTTADTGSPIRASQEYVFLLQRRSNPNISWFALYPCGILTENQANLAMVREAAPNGADLKVQ
jgi:hypothetical protein